ncbi:hypothetical protein ACWDAO_36690, partial [Streptomyces sp. NPDC001212]
MCSRPRRVPLAAVPAPVQDGPEAEAPVQGLDPDRVVYLGTASKSLAPGLRLAWMALPPSL